MELRPKRSGRIADRFVQYITNRAKLYMGRSRRPLFDGMDSDTLLKLIKLFYSDTDMDLLEDYVHQFQQDAREMTKQDVEEALALISIQEIHNS